MHIYHRVFSSDTPTESLGKLKPLKFDLISTIYRLFQTSMRNPVRKWLVNDEGPTEICSLTWSKSVPSVFFATTSAGKLLSWDLLVDDKEPLYSETIANSKKEQSRSMLSISSTRIQTTSPSLVTATGTSVSVRKLSPEFATPSTSKDIEAMETYMQHAF